MGYPPDVKAIGCGGVGTTDFEAVCRDTTGDEGVDVVLDCIGGSYLGKNLRVLGLDGRLVTIGLMGGTTGELDLRRVLSKRIRIIGSTLRGLHVTRKAAIVSSFLLEFGDALSRGKLRPIIDCVYPMEQIEEAHQRLASGEAFGKVVLSIG